MLRNAEEWTATRDGGGNLAVFSHGNARVQLFGLSDRAYIRYVHIPTLAPEVIWGHSGFIAFDAQCNLAVSIMNHPSIEYRFDG